MVKRIISAILSIFCVFSLSGCNFGVQASYREDINVALDKALRSVVYYEYIDENGLSPIKFYWGSDFYETYSLECKELQEYSNKEISDALLYNYSFEIKDVVLEDENTAVCSVEITNVDMLKLYDKLVETLLAMVISEEEEANENKNENSEEDFLEKEQGVSINGEDNMIEPVLPTFEEVFMTTLYRDSLEMITTEVSITMIGNSNSWQVQDTESIVDTIYGGYFSKFDELYSMYINDAN